MRKIFNENYFMLQQIAPDLFREQDYYLIHEFSDSVGQNISIENMAEDMIGMGTYFEQNGDVMSDPSMWVKFDIENGTARICNFALDKVSLYYTFDFDDCNDIENTDEEKDCNNYLNGYLKELLGSVQDDSNYFERVAIKRI